jgi:DNA ligase-1
MAKEQLAGLLASVLEKGGEGVMLRRRSLFWMPERVSGLLKVKPEFDAEATVIGYILGESGRTGRLLGKMGAAICRMSDGKVFNLSGWTDEQRSLKGDAATAYAVAHPGEQAPEWIVNPFIPRGTRISYLYRELTRDGYPREARFLRLRPEGV